MTDRTAISFPDESRSELDRVLEDLMARARQVQVTQERLRSLLKANQLVVQQLDLPVLLGRIVEAAVELVGAEYGALGVVSPRGDLEQFIHVGMSDAHVAAVGHLPEGHGLLGALIEDPVAIRLDHLSHDPRSTGFPAAHPAMDSFLGVPVRVRDEVYGNLYLSNQKSGRFSAEDEQLVTALAATAGIAIENARLFSETRIRQAWSATSSEVTAAMLSAEDGNAVEVLASRVVSLADAAIVCVLLPTPDRTVLAVATARGLDDDIVDGTLKADSESIVHGVLEGGQPRLIDGADEVGLTLPSGRRLGPAMVVPLVTAGRAKGVLLVARLAGARRYSTTDLTMAADFAGQASLAMELYSARADQQRMSLLEDRGRIARDLHDHVIQQLFATGLELSSVARALPAGVEAERIEDSISRLDASIAQIRTVIFALDGLDGVSVRLSLIDLVNELSVGLTRTPALTFSGPVDLMVTDSLARDVLAVAREGLSNAVRHASAEHTALDLSVLGGSVVVEVTDDGVGCSEGGRRSGLANLEHRAARRGGTLDFDSNGSGTRLRWSVPTTARDAAGPDERRVPK
jgi:signal transduction histidine kinase